MANSNIIITYHLSMDREVAVVFNESFKAGEAVHLLQSVGGHVTLLPGTDATVA